MIEVKLMISLVAEAAHLINNTHRAAKGYTDNVSWEDMSAEQKETIVQVITYQTTVSDKKLSSEAYCKSISAIDELFRSFKP